MLRIFRTIFTFATFFHEGEAQRACRPVPKSCTSLVAETLALYQCTRSSSRIKSVCAHSRLGIFRHTKRCIRFLLLTRLITWLCLLSGLRAWPSWSGEDHRSHRNETCCNIIGKRWAQEKCRHTSENVLGRPYGAAASGKCNFGTMTYTIDRELYQSTCHRCTRRWEKLSQSTR